MHDGEVSLGEEAKDLDEEGGVVMLWSYVEDEQKLMVTTYWTI